MSIQEHLNKIRNAVYGREVRESIAKGIETAYDDASENGNANMEVKIARGTHPNLRSRLEEVDSKQQQTNAQLAQNTGQLISQSDRIDNLILESGGDSSLEVTDARLSTQRNELHSTLSSRLDKTEKDFYRGTMATNLLTNSLFDEGVENWSSYSGSSLTTANRELKVVNTSESNDFGTTSIINRNHSIEKLYVTAVVRINQPVEEMRIGISGSFIGGQYERYKNLPVDTWVRVSGIVEHDNPDANFFTLTATPFDINSQNTIEIRRPLAISLSSDLTVGGTPNEEKMFNLLQSYGGHFEGTVNLLNVNAVDEDVERLKDKTLYRLENLIQTGRGTWHNSANSLSSIDFASGIHTFTSNGNNQNPQAIYHINGGVSDYYTKLQFKVIDPNNNCHTVSVTQGSIRKDITDFKHGEWHDFSDIYTDTDFNRLLVLWRFNTKEQGQGTQLQIRRVLSLDIKGTFKKDTNKHSLDNLLKTFDDDWFEGVEYINQLEMLSPLNEIDFDFPSEKISVKNFGAKGDGVTDDTSAIQLALNSLAGQRVLIPKGEYIVSGTITIPSNTTLYGEGKSSRIKLADSYNLTPALWRDELGVYPIIRTAENSKGVTLRDLYVEGSDTYKNQRQLGVAFIDTVNGLAENVYVNRINWFPTTQTSSLAYNIATLRASKVTIRGGEFTYGGYECVGIADGSRDILVDGIHASIGWRTVLQIHRDCERIKVVNSFLYQDWDDSHAVFTFHGAQGAPINDVVIDNNTMISLNDLNSPYNYNGSVQINDNTQSNNIRITNNVIKGRKTGVFSSGIHNYIITNNVIECEEGFGLYFENSCHNVFLDNNIVDKGAGENVIPEFVVLGNNIGLD